MAVRLMTYVGLLYQDLIKGGQITGRHLPPVLPIVFYTGDTPWSAATIRLERQQSPRDLARFIEALHRWFADDAELERILSVWIREYLLRDLRPELNVPEAHDLGEITMQLAERFKQWEREVKTEGRLEGRLEGEALVLQRQLTRRFGSLPEWAQQRLRSASSEELETWADRVLDATRLEEVFG